ncbi:arylesterase [Horticoccus luteus]|uniref:Arylesterase n=1 Tax=Horticoccus luteus TaxID=2862869 RepID=A0A8F9TWQ9_9BACT|nr:arylesterase [Horticoccus luteus]QYM79401.1 arylesterase [Horticoccus luteus]
MIALRFCLLLGLAATLRAAAPAPKTIVFFGDSLTAGYGLDAPEREAFPALIQQRIAAAHLPYRVVNAGVSGETTAGGLRRIDWVLRQPVDVFVLALGGNDGLRGIDPAVTRANLQAIIDHVRAKAPAAPIVLAGMQMPASMGERFTTRFRSLFPDLAEKNHLTLVPFLLEGVGAVPALNQADMIHPNAAGHRLLADNVWRVLEPLLR